MTDRRPPDDDEDDDPGRRWRSLVALLLIAVLAAGALWLVFYWKREGALEDCLMSGRSNCSPTIDGR